MTRPRRRWARLLWIPAAAVIPVGYMAVHIRGEMMESRVAAAQLDVQMIASGIEDFRRDRGRYPTKEEGIRAVIEQGYVKSVRLGDRALDPWGRPYFYERPGRVHPARFDVTSYGLDGQPGGVGENADICNE